MRILKKFILIVIVIHVQSLPFDETKTVAKLRSKRFLEKFFSAKKNDETTIKPPQDLNIKIGECGDDDKLIYVDDTRIESNNSTLSGVLEIHLDSPFSITCVDLKNQMPAGFGATAEKLEGGQGHKFIKVNVEGKYGHGIHFKIYVWGKLDEKLIEKSQG